jgi:ligand-binding sensor domain-containing protein
MRQSLIASGLAFLVLLIPALGSADIGPNLTFWPSPVGTRLSQIVVTESFQDKTGMMWFSTQEGLNVYDGKRVEKYLPN